MTGTGTCDRSIVFDPDKQISPFMIHPISQTNDRFDKISIVQGPRAFPFKFDIECFALTNQGLSFF
jgi:hypothetical protein